MIFRSRFVSHRESVNQFTHPHSVKKSEKSHHKWYHFRLNLAMLLQPQAMFSSLEAIKTNKDNFNPTSPLSSTASTASSSPMMDISPLERAFAEEQRIKSNSSQNVPPFPPVSASAMATAAALTAASNAASADHNGNNGNKTPSFPFHPASLAAAFNLRPPQIPQSPSSSALNLSAGAQAASALASNHEERRSESPSETDRQSNTSSKELGKLNRLIVFFWVKRAKRV